MRTRYISLFIFIGLLLLQVKGNAQQANWISAAKSGGSSTDEVTESCLDAQGNIYYLGAFAGTATIAGVSLTSAGSSDLFVAKYTKEGNVVWVSRAGGTGADAGSGIAVDNSGNVYVTGYYASSSFTFGNTVTNAGGNDVFLLKFNANGTAGWIKSYGNTGDDRGAALAIDGSSGDCFFTGNYNSSINFDGTVLTTVGGQDIFVTKISLSSEIIQWAKGGGSTGADYANDIQLSSSLCVLGTVSGNVTFGTRTGSLAGGGNTDICLIQYSPGSGTESRVTLAGGTGYDQAGKMAISSSERINITGSFAGTATFGAAGSVTAVGGTDVFVAQYTSAAAGVWVKNAGSTAADVGADITTDAYDNIFVTGSYSGTITFGSLSAMTCSGGADIFLAKYNDGGTEQWSLRAGGTSNEAGKAVLIDRFQRIWLGGLFQGSATFGSYSLTASGFDAFMTSLFEGYVWTGTSSVSWNNAANWIPASIPAASDNVAIYTAANNPQLTANTSVARFGIAGGTLNLNGYTLTTTGDAVFNAGAANNGTINSTGNTVTYEGTNFSAAVTATCANMYLHGSVFNSTLTLTKTGSTANYSNGGNSFNGTTSLTNTSSALVSLAELSPDVFNGNVTFTKSGTGILRAARVGDNYFRGHITCNGDMYFNGTPTGRMIFDGVSTQNINATGIVSVSVMVADKTSGNIQLNTSVTTYSLLFTATATCKINTGSNVLKLTTVSGNNASCYVNGIVENGTMVQVNSILFPVGTSTAYMPVTLNTVAGENGQSNDIYRIQAYTTTPPANTSFDHIVEYINPFYWNVTKVSGSTAMELVLPWNSATPGVIHPQDELVAQYDGNKWKAAGNKNLTISGTNGSVTSFPLSASGYFTLGYRAPNPDACAACDPAINWISVRDFDEYGRVINEQRVFADHLGRVKQSQQRNLEEDKILAKAIVYDTYGRPVLSTLPAPVAEDNFAYTKNFISTGALCGPSGSQYNCPYTYADFDVTANLNNPVAVSASSPLGNYYSTGSEEAYIATSSYPYSRVDYNNTIIGGVMRSSGPGNAMKMGAGHENRGVVLPAYDELADYMAFKNKYFVNAGTSLDGEVLKTVLKDENGTESITYTDKSGKTIVSCLSREAGESDYVPVTVDIKAKFSDYVLSVPANTTFTGVVIESQDYVNVIYSGGGTYSGLASGNPYKELTAGTTLTVASNKPFSVTYNSIATTGEFAKGKVYSTEYNYLTNSVDVHLQSNHQLALTQSITGNTVRIYNLETGALVYNGGVSGVASAGIAPGFYRIIYDTQSTGYSFATNAYITVSYRARYKNHAYYYYDNAGRLLGQTAPLGVVAGSAGANPSYTSKYTYNSLNWLLSSQDPDRGLTYYVYQKDGRLRFMQDQLQRTNNRFAYINYDNIQRPVATGEYSSGASGQSPNTLYFQHMLDNYNGLSIPTGYTNIFTSLNAGTAVTGTTNLATVSRMDYDVPFSLSSVRTGYTQRNVNGRVSRSSNEHTTYWYSYDERGRLEWTVQQLTGTAGTTFSSTAADRVKTNNYSYDFRSHLLSVSYQKDVTAEKLDHFYSYDAMMRLSRVETKSGNDALTENAEYKYYLHGPLKRKEIGNDLQGMDYVYTINGMLKAINHPNLDGNDPGRDNFSAIPGQEDHSGFFKDVFGMVLEYYDNDYTNGTKYQTTSNLTSAGYQQYYNGIIRSWTWNTRLPVEDPNPNPVQYAYKYDAKYQLTEALYGDHNKTTNAFDAGTGKYNVTGITYDLNGNLSTLSRKDQSGLVQSKDNINYTLGTGNQLASTHSGTPGSPTRSYGYDVIGRMTSYTNTIGERNKYMQYDYTGKVTAVYRSTGTSQPLVTYLYDEKGHKIRKTSYHPTTYAITEHTWYINDAAGNVLSVYKTVAGTTSQKEAFVYGTERIGVVNKYGTTEYHYELKDHLGNVRAVIRKFSNNLEVLDASDYYPHGGRMPGRGKISGDGYRYGYQGEWAERNTDMADEVVDFDLRMYDATLGRFLSPDPYYQYHSPYMAMHNNPISTIDPDGGNGMGGYGATGGGATPNYGGMPHAGAPTPSPTGGSFGQGTGIGMSGGMGATGSGNDFNNTQGNNIGNNEEYQGDVKNVRSSSNVSSINDGLYSPTILETVAEPVNSSSNTTTESVAVGMNYSQIGPNGPTVGYGSTNMMPAAGPYNNLSKEPINVEKLIIQHFWEPHGYSDQGQIEGFSSIYPLEDQLDFDYYGKSLAEKLFQIENPVTNSKIFELSINSEGKGSGIFVRPTSLILNADKFNFFETGDSNYFFSLSEENRASVVFYYILNEVNIHLTVEFEIIKK